MAAAETIEWFRIPDLPGVDVLLAERATRRWHVFHETYAVCTLLDISGGETEWNYRQKRYCAKAGELMLMEPGEVHSNPHTIPPCDFRVLFVDSSIVEAAARELGIAHAHWKSGHGIDPLLRQGLIQLHASLEGAAGRLERESRFVACLRGLLERHSESKPRAWKQRPRPALLRARDFIRENYSRVITLEALAAATGLSRFHLVREFSREFGLPPHQYKLHIQVEKARDLLAVGFPAAMIASETGFADQSHFIRHFRKINGVTPGRYLLAGAERTNRSERRHDYPRDGDA